MTFEELKLDESLCRALRDEGYTSPTPIQAQAIPHALAGKDLVGCAQTGTGKTAAFALPILQRLSHTAPTTRNVRCLVLTPTRELASQISESFSTYGRGTRLKNTVIFGGVGQDPQVQALRRGVDILIATPGRLLDLISQRLVSFPTLEVLVLDEADRMLDMGFIRDVKKILAVLPKKRQTLFFSATMPPDIQELADSMLVDPVRVAVVPVATTAETIDQRLYLVERDQKRNLLIHVLKDPAIARALVFTRTKNGANRVAKHLNAAGVRADAIHGNKSQNARERALDAFKDGDLRILVATDIAARGIDIDGVTHVINFEIPNIPESYVHRIGRTGRAGAAGIALSFCDAEERAYIRDIERLIRRTVPVQEDNPFRSTVAPGAAPPPGSTTQDRRQHGRGGGGGGGRHERGGGGGGGRGGRGGRQGGRGGRGGRGGGRGGQDSRQSQGGGGGGSGSQPAAARPAAPALPAKHYPKWG